MRAKLWVICMEDRNSNSKYKLILLILLIIVLLLMYFLPVGRVTDNNLIPTGDVNVFDIDIKCDCINEDCTFKNNNKKKVEKIDISDDKVISDLVSKESKNVSGTVYVDDLDGNYLYLQKLNIFTNSAYEYTNKIAPGVSNTYQFVVHNSSDSKIKYKIGMLENTDYKINLVYRLKNNGSYIIGNDNKWVSVDKLNTSYLSLEPGVSDSYSLDWKWLYDKDDVSDTIAGKNMDNEYKLNIKVYFEAVD